MSAKEQISYSQLWTLQQRMYLSVNTIFQSLHWLSWFLWFMIAAYNKSIKSSGEIEISPLKNCGRHHEWVDHYRIYVSQMTTDYSNCSHNSVHFSWNVTYQISRRGCTDMSDRTVVPVLLLWCSCFSVLIFL